MNNQKTQSVKIAKMAMLVAVSIVLVMIIHFPIFPAVAFLEYDPADIPILIGTFAFGAGGRYYSDHRNLSHTGIYGQLSQRPVWHNNAHTCHVCAGSRGGDRIQEKQD